MVLMVSNIDCITAYAAAWVRGDADFFFTHSHIIDIVACNIQASVLMSAESADCDI